MHISMEAKINQRQPVSAQDSRAVTGTLNICRWTSRLTLKPVFKKELYHKLKFLQGKTPVYSSN